MNTNWLAQPCASLNESSRAAALARQGQLTKPPGSLGRLEAIAVQLSAMQGTDKPQIERTHISIFAADHGVAAEGVSAFPQAVTAEMVRNFARGGAAISVLAKQLNATLEVVNLGTVSQVEPLANVRDERIAAGTANLAQTPAMTGAQLDEALQAGRAALLRAKQNGAQLFIGGRNGHRQHDFGKRRRLRTVARIAAIAGRSRHRAGQQRRGAQGHRNSARAESAPRQSGATAGCNAPSGRLRDRRADGRLSGRRAKRHSGSGGWFHQLGCRTGRGALQPGCKQTGLSTRTPPSSRAISASSAHSTRNHCCNSACDWAKAAGRLWPCRC